jgi:hypothetical protein
MARIRSVKPSFFRSSTVTTLPLPARLTFIGLWTYVDDEGRGLDDSRLIKADIWPLDDHHTSKRVETDLCQIAAAGLIERYTVSDKHFLRVRSWKEHQRISHPSRSEYPPPPDETPDESPHPHGGFPEASRNPHGILREASAPEGKGSGREVEGKGREEPSSPTGDIDPPPTAPLTLVDTPPADPLDGFNDFWTTWPKRNGKRLDRAKAETVWRNLTLPERRAAHHGARHYAQASADGLAGAMDAHRWLRNRSWPDWQQPATPDIRPDRNKPSGLDKWEQAARSDPRLAAELAAKHNRPPADDRSLNRAHGL